MTSAQIRLFSTLSSASRNASYGVTATFGAFTITIACQPLTDLELASGGWESAGMMRALVSGIIIPNVHDHITIDTKTWVVRKKVESLASIEVGLTLEAISVASSIPSGGGYEVESEDFFTRAGITSITQKTAVNDLVVSLKSANIWTKMHALYPLVGGTASSHRENLKSSSYAITWSGTETHSSNGMAGDGNNVAVTNLNLNTTTEGSIAYGAYNKTTGFSAAFYSEDIGCVAPPIFYTVLSRYSDNTFVGRASAENPSITVTGITDARGFHIVTRQSMNLYKAFKNGAQIGTNQTDIPTTPLPSVLFYLGGTHTLALAFISDGLNDNDVLQLSAAVETFQTTLARAN